MEPPRPEINVKWDSKETCFFFSAISLQKMHLKEVKGQKLLHAVPGIKSEKTIFFGHFFADNFFRTSLLATFSTDSNSASNTAFFIAIVHF
jgi:hypothetical protein